MPLSYLLNPPSSFNSLPLVPPTYQTQPTKTNPSKCLSFRSLSPGFTSTSPTDPSPPSSISGTQQVHLPRNSKSWSRETTPVASLRYSGLMFPNSLFQTPRATCL